MWYAVTQRPYSLLADLHCFNLILTLYLEAACTSVCTVWLGTDLSASVAAAHLSSDTSSLVQEALPAAMRCMWMPPGTRSQC